MDNTKVEKHVQVEQQLLDEFFVISGIIIACEQQTHFRSSLLSPFEKYINIFRRERSDDRKCVCCSQASIIKVEVSVSSRAEGLGCSVTLTETLIIPDIIKIESNNCCIINCFEINNDKFTVRHCSWKSCFARTTYRLVIYLLADN